jgi:hypothetical protein
MNLITMESAVYDNLMARLDNFEAVLKKTMRTASYPLSERWLTTETLCTIFDCSKRTLQMYRDEHMLPFSQIKHRMYYRAIDVEKFLNENLKVIRENNGRRKRK